MKEFVWVLDEVVLALHDEQLAAHGGLSGIRDRGAVESALARPRNLAAYEACDDIARLAAAYAYGVARNHGFADGNKRTALVTPDLFLMLNGYELVSSPVENVLTILSLAEGSLSEVELTFWIRQNIRSLKVSQSGAAS
jgi:death-on-curing protein